MFFNSGYSLVTGAGKYSFMSDRDLPVAARGAQAVTAQSADFNLAQSGPQFALVNEVSLQKSLRHARGQGAKAMGQAGTLIVGDFSGNPVFWDDNHERRYPE